MRHVDSARVIAGLGIEGDAHAASEGPRTPRQVLLMDSETLDEMGLKPSQIRENVTTTGLAPGSIAAGQRLALGDDVVLEVTGDCAPCGRMDEIRAGLRERLEGRRGLLATVIEGGTMTVGDTVRPI
jgi:MOSC domain-containing protein YiiM